jgi:hypothetical protein
MSRGPAKFKQCDVTRAIKAMVAAGASLDRVRAAVDKDGRIVVFVGKPPDDAPLAESVEIVL